MAAKSLNRRELVKKILGLRRDLTEAYVDKLINEKLRSSGGFLTEEGAAFLVAQDLGVRVVEGSTPQRFEMRLGSLTENLRDVSITVRLISLYGSEEFTRKDGSRGRVLRATIADPTGTADLVVWDEKAEALRARPNQFVRIFHGYTRRGPSGRLEVHVGHRSEVQVLEEGEGPTEVWLGGASSFREIASLRAQERDVNLRGEVLELFPVSTFRRPGGPGKVVKVRLGDETGTATIVIWNDKVDLYAQSLRKGCILRIYGARTKAALDGKPEVHVDGRSMIEVEASLRPQPEAPIPTIGQLPRMGVVDGLIAQVVASAPLREFSRAGGGRGKMASLLIGDGTGFARLVLWDEKAYLAQSLKVGDWILIRGGYVREGVRGPEIHLNSGGSLESRPPSEGGPSPSLGSRGLKASSIRDLKEDEGYVTVEGTLMEAPSAREVVTQGGREAKVASFILSDSTGTLRISLWNRLAEEAAELKRGDAIRVENLFLRRGLGGDLEASSGEFSSLKVLGRSSDGGSHR